MPKFYILEEMTQDDLNKLALERNTLAHNWNELKKWMNSEIERFEDNPYTRLGIAVFTKVLDKMQELEEGGNNE